MFDLRNPPRPKVICLGLSAFDVTWTVESLALRAGKTRAHDFREGGGGMAANAAVAAARLGAQARFWGRAGQDSAGRAMREDLAAQGVDVSGFRLFENARSSVSGIVVDRKGERSIVNFRGAGLPEDPGWLPADAIAEADARGEKNYRGNARGAIVATLICGVLSALVLYFGALLAV